LNAIQDFHRSKGPRTPMTITDPMLLGLLALGLVSGLLGALVGIGGGVVIVPALLLVFGFDVRIAVATSLLGVVATSVAAGSVHLGSGLANLRIGLSLEVVTIAGGIAGGLIATSIDPQLLSVLLGVVLGVSATLLLKGRDEHGQGEASGDPVAVSAHQAVGRLAGTYLDGRSGQLVAYEAKRIPVGASVAFGAGALSGMLGVGGGFLKVPAMHLLMQLPLKVSAATSNFMVGLTALASLFIYVARGYLYPYPAATVVIGVMLGGLSGARLQHRSSPTLLRLVLAGVLAFVAVQLVLRGSGA
jgi:uncharacterized membrane protein YfcA